MSGVLFTIITPVFNREDCIGKCIDSVVKQQYEKLEMLIVDDGSSDKTNSIVRSFVDKHDFIKLHTFEQNKGVNAARNWAIANSRGKYILFLDSDDLFVDGALDSIEKHIQAKSEYNHFLFMQDDRIENYEKFGLLSKQDCVITFSDFLLNKIYGDFSHVILADIFKKYLFDEKLRIYEGLNFLRIYRENQQMLFCPVLIEQRDRDRADSVSNDYQLKSKLAIAQKFSMYKSLLSEFGKDYAEYDKTGDISIPMSKEAYLLGLASTSYDLGFIDNFLANWNAKVPTLFRVINKLRLGNLLRVAIVLYSRLNFLLKK